MSELREMMLMDQVVLVFISRCAVTVRVASSYSHRTCISQCLLHIFRDIELNTAAGAFTSKEKFVKEEHGEK